MDNGNVSFVKGGTISLNNAVANMENIRKI
jgi:hypothetical protein